MKGFNLSVWALNNRPLLRYFIVVLGMLGVWSYLGLGQSEDPPFTFKVMVVQTQWPGATAAEITEQVTEKIEKKLQEIPDLDYLRSYSRPGESQVFVVIKDSIPASQRPRRVLSGAQEDRRHPLYAAGRHRRARSSTTNSATPTATSTR